RPSDMHDALRNVLGLGRVVEIESMLKAARRDMTELRNAVTGRLSALTAVLSGHEDPRAREVEAVLASVPIDLHRLTALAAGEEAADDRIVPKLRQLAGLSLPGPEAI